MSGIKMFCLLVMFVYGVNSVNRQLFKPLRGKNIVIKYLTGALMYFNQ